MASSPDKLQTTYDPKYFSPLFVAEERHFWFKSRNRILERMVKEITTSLPDGYKVMEVGCGTGNVLRMLEKACSRGLVAGMDLFSDGLKFARRRVQIPLVQGDMVHPPFRTKFDLVCMFDVLEHLPDDESILRSVSDLLGKDGHLLLTVPADPRLWSFFDTASHHFRRYTRADLLAKMERAGFEVEFISPYMLAIYPMVWVTRRLTRSGDGPLSEDEIEKMSTEELNIVPVVNEILTWVLSREAAWLGAGKHLPVGTSILAVGRKKR
jgi:SAM-dependent methyltransferase